MDSLKVKKILLIITYTVGLYVALSHLDVIQSAAGILLAILVPFIYGICIAYILNMPYEFFQRKVFGPRKTLALISAYVSVLIASALIVWFVIPQLGSSINQLIDKMPSYLVSLQTLLNDLIRYFKLENYLASQTASTWTDLLQSTTALLNSFLQNVLNSMLNLANDIYNWIIGFIFSIYMLTGKDQLLRQLQGFLKAFLPGKWVEELIGVSGRTNLIFNRFIKGSLIDSILVGILCFIGMSLFGIPYALLVSVIQGLTNIIPVFGPFIGAVPSTFIILMDDPFKALIFVIFIVILQQVDGNIIQPRIVGNAIGLPGIWVLLAIVVGSGLFGIVGLIVGVPAAAVLYALLKEAVQKRLDVKKTLK